MAYIGRTPTGSILTGADIADGSISTAKIADNAIVTGKITDGTIATGDIADSAVTVAKTSGVGISMADMWRITSNYAIPSSETVIGSAIARVDDGTFAQIGTGMTQSSGTWTFPQTGLYHVKFNATRIRTADGDFNCTASIYGTPDNSNYDHLCQGAESVNANQSISFGSISIEVLFNCTNTSTHKVQFFIGGGNDSFNRRLDGSGLISLNSFVFFRIGDSQ